MSALLILGAGGHARSVADAALATKHWDSVAFLDDNPQNNMPLGFPILGGLDLVPKLRKRYDGAFVAWGNNILRMEWIDRLDAMGFDLPCVIHPHSCVSHFAVLGKGCVVMAGAVINVEARVGRGCILNTGCTVDHNCVLGNGVHLSPGVHVGGDTTIGARTWVCVGASIGSQRSISGDCIIAAGSAVVKDILEPGLYAGVPAIRKR